MGLDKMGSSDWSGVIKAGTAHVPHWSRSNARNSGSYSMPVIGRRAWAPRQDKRADRWWQRGIRSGHGRRKM